MSEATTITIACDPQKVSDGYHTFEELYEHRQHLFIALMLSHLGLSWRASSNSDGSSYEGWFVAGMHLPTGDISYHLPNGMWGLLEGLTTTLNAPKWDGHTSQVVVARLAEWAKLLGRDHG